MDSLFSMQVCVLLGERGGSKTKMKQLLDLNLLEWKMAPEQKSENKIIEKHFTLVSSFFNGPHLLWCFVQTHRKIKSAATRRHKQSITSSSGSEIHQAPPEEQPSSCRSSDFIKISKKTELWCIQGPADWVGNLSVWVEWASNVTKEIRFLSLFYWNISLFFSKLDVFWF